MSILTPASRSRFTLLVSLLLLLAFSCRKSDKIDNSPGLTLAFSTDTVFFDTVFPTIGSITKRLLVYNNNKNKVNISSITLAGGQASAFRINIDGSPALQATDVEVPGEDSIFIFVQVTIDPHNSATPYVVDDSLQFITNNTRQQVKLVAWGRDAVFHLRETIRGHVSWDSTRAHVIYDDLRVDTGALLFVHPGTRIYLHMNAGISVSSQATLKMAGTIEHPVRLAGDRLDPYYKDLPGQWRGIDLERGSKDHLFMNVHITNGSYGIAADSLGSANWMVDMGNCIIRNMTGYGIYAYGSSVRSVNCVIGDCGRSCISLNYGGSYSFKYLTVGNYWYSSVRTAPSVYLSNYAYDDLGNKIGNALENAHFENVIIYGSDPDEVLLDSVPSGIFNYTFDHAIVRTGINTTGSERFVNVLANEDPLFVDPSVWDYRIDSLSPAIGAGKDLFIPEDILGNPRSVTPALGAYEFVPGR